MKKRIISVLLTFAMLCTLMPAALAAPTTPYQVVTVDKTTVQQGETVNVKVTLPNISETAGSFTVNLKFDKTLFEVTKVNKPPKVNCTDNFGEAETVSMVAGNASDSNDSGELTANAAYSLNTLQVAGVTVIDATLKAKASGSAVFSFTTFEITKSESGSTVKLVQVSDLETPPSVTIPKAPIASVTASVDQPMKGTALDTTVDLDGATAYTGAVKWYVGETEATETTAKANTIYTAKITLTAKDGESFANTVTAPTGYTLGECDNSKVVLTKTFTKTADKNALQGTVSITGTLKFDEKLTANTESLDYNGESSGTLSYQWIRGGVYISGATNKEYTLTAADVGNSIAVEVKNSNNSGSVVGSTGSSIVAKADGPAAPSGLAEVSKTDTTITVTQNSAWEYSKDNGSIWQDSNTFTGLTSNTTYNQIVARVKATATHEASAACSAISITTSKATADDELKRTLTSAVIAYTGTYDGAAHDAFTVGSLPSGWSAQYADSESGSYSTTMPKVTNVSDSKTLWVKFSNSSYSDFVTSYSVNVKAKNISGVSINLGTQATYSGTEQNVAISSVKDGTVSLIAGGHDYEVVSGNKATDVGNNTLTIEGKGNYTGTAQKDWTLVAKEVTITPDAKSKTYGEADPTLTYTTNIDSDTTLKPLFDAAVGTTKLGRAAGEDVGSYDIEIGTLTAGNNFNLKMVTPAVNFSITAKDVAESRAAVSQTVVKGVGDFTPPTFGDITGTLTYNYDSATTYEGVKAKLAALAADATGTINYTYTATGNYTGTITGSITFTVVDVTFDIQADAITVATNPTYGSKWSQIVSFDASKITAKVGSDTCSSPTYTLKDADTVPNSGSQTYTITFSGTINGVNYTDVTVKSDSVSIGKATVTVAAGDYKVSKVYDGTTSAGTASGALAVSGILPADSGVTVTLTIGAYSNANVGTGNVNVSLSISGDTNNNYQLGAVSVSVPCEITQATLTMDGTASATADYGTALKDIPITGLTAKLNGSNVAGSWAFSGETILDAGNTTAYTATFTPSTGADNYNTLTSSIVPTINKIAYTGSAITANKNVMTNTAVNGVEVDMTSLLTAIKGAAVSAASKGSDSDNIINNVSKDGNKVKFDVASIAASGKNATINVTISSTNYTDITATITVTTVNKSDAGVSISGAPASKTYGDPNFPVTASAEHSEDGGTWIWTSSNESVLKVTGTSTTGTVQVVGQGSATITAKYESANYLGEATSASITVNKKDVTVKPKDFAITKGSAIPVFALEYTGLVGSDTLTPDTAPAFTCYEADGTTAVSTSTAAGTYTITWANKDAVSFTGADNYNVTMTATGTLTVNPAYSGGGGGSVTTYSVTVGKTENGTVSVSPKSAAKGSTVTITVTPDKGYVLETLTVLDKDGKELKLTEKDGKYTFTMPAGKVEVKATFMDDNTVLNYFVDVKAGDYFYDAVLWAAQKGITNGINDTEFGPSLSCTRAQIVTFLWRAAGSPEPKGTGSFADVPAGSYYAKAVAWAVENGITGGTGDGKFDPDATCTREQAVTFLYRASGSPAVSGGSAFSDVAANAYYADAVAWAEKNEITGGIGGGLFGSGNNCTRGQIVTFLYRAFNK